MHQLKDSPQPLGGSVGSIPSTFIDGRASSSSSDLHTLQKALRAQGIQSTPASNLKFSEFTRNAQHDGSPSIASTRKIQTSRSYSHDLRNHSDTSTNLTRSAYSSASSSNTNLNMPDISPSSSQFFEVMYVGKIKVSHKRVPFTFIDDALPKFKAYDTQRIREQQVNGSILGRKYYRIRTNNGKFGIVHNRKMDPTKVITKVAHRMDSKTVIVQMMEQTSNGIPSQI